MDKKTINKIMSMAGKIYAGHSEHYDTHILHHIINHPKITKEQLAQTYFKVSRRRKAVLFTNEHLAQKYIDAVRECMK